MSLIKAIQITGLNGQIDIKLNIHQRHCIMVGPNGSGKSTALQIIASALGRQWKRLSELNFEEIQFTFRDGTIAAISNEQAKRYTRLRSGFSGRVPPRVFRTLQQASAWESFLSDDISNAALARKYSDILRMPASEMRDLQVYAKAQVESDLFDSLGVPAFTKILLEKGVPTTLFLPTYRRIELELGRMFERAPESYKSVLTTDQYLGISNEFIVELVRFGMDDINRTLKQVEIGTREFAQNRFNAMMTSYLKEMANQEVISVRDLRERDINQEKIEQVLSRIEEGLLSGEEKEKIADIILDTSSSSSGGNPSFYKKWLAHFFVKLLEVDKEISRREYPVRRFVDTLQKYFSPGKIVEYDIEKYHFSLKTKGDIEEIALSDLSSGEKQLISVLSHINFSPQRKLNILIDEPELSLSVPWQADFLPDISKMPTCNQIFAVTHSPFIYDHMADDVIDFRGSKYHG